MIELIDRYGDTLKTCKVFDDVWYEFLRDGAFGPNSPPPSPDAEFSDIFQYVSFVCYEFISLAYIVFPHQGSGSS